MLKKINALLKEYNIVEEKDINLYLYGFNQLFIITLNIITTIVIGFIFKMAWQSIAFTLSYIPLRSYAGGYHAKTQYRCYVVSVFLISLSLFLIRNVTWSNSMLFISVISASFLILILSPVEDNNKKLDTLELQVFRKRTQIVLAIEIILSVLLFIIKQEKVTICIAVSIIISSVMVLLGKIINIQRRI